MRKPARSTTRRRAAARVAATPRRSAAKAPAPGVVSGPPARGESARQRVMAVARAGIDKKAEEVLLLDVRGLVSYTEFLVLMSADSEPQAAAIADEVDRRLGALGARPLGVEGRVGGRWVLLDYGDVVAHVMFPETRQFYDLEGLWADAPRERVEA